MGETTISSQLTDIQKAVAHYLGLGLVVAKWSANDVLVIAAIIKRGLRQFYYPPKLEQQERPHEWRFLKPTVTLETVGSYSTGTIAITLAGTTVTLTTGVWPSWTATHGALVVDNTEYTIDTRTDDTHLELSSAWTEDTETAAEYTLRHDGNYDLPDDFGGIEGDLTHAPTENKPNIDIIGEGRLRSLRRGRTIRTYPAHAAIRPKETHAGTDGQRFEIMFEPIPNDAYTLYYRKVILPAALTGSIIYHYGGAAHAETVEASCIAMAELQEDEKRGPMWDYFLERLTASISVDQTAFRAEKFGYNSDRSDELHGDIHDHRRHHQTNIVTYNGEI